MLTGVTKFSRSGLVSIAVTKTSATVTGVALTAASLVLAKLQVTLPGVFVEAVVPDVSGHSFAIYLSEAVSGREDGRGGVVRCELIDRCPELRFAISDLTLGFQLGVSRMCRWSRDAVIHTPGCAGVGQLALSKQATTDGAPIAGVLGHPTPSPGSPDPNHNMRLSCRTQ